jgi:hypothetical protein
MQQVRIAHLTLLFVLIIASCKAALTTMRLSSHRAHNAAVGRQNSPTELAVAECV